MPKLNYLKLYEAWMTRGRLPQNGLCYSLDPEHMGLFIDYFCDNRLGGYWGYEGVRYEIHYDNREEWTYIVGGKSVSYEEMAHGFTSLRQNIILLLAAINGEL